MTYAQAIRRRYKHLSSSQFFLGSLIDDCLTSELIRYFPKQVRRTRHDDTNQADFVIICEDSSEIPISFKHAARENQSSRSSIWFCLRWGTSEVPSEYTAECSVLVLLSCDHSFKEKSQENISSGFYFCSRDHLRSEILERGLRKNNRTNSGYSYLYLLDQFEQSNNIFVVPKSHVLGDEHAEVDIIFRVIDGH